MKAILGNIEGYKVNDSFLFKMGDRPIPFYIKNTSSSTITVKVYGVKFCYLDYSYDARTWTHKGVGSNYQTIASKIDDIPAGSTMYIKSTELAFQSRLYNYEREYHGFFQITGGSCIVGGNLSILIWGDNMVGELPGMSGVSGLFNGCTTLTDASNLILPDVENFQRNLNYMFMGCTSLTKGPFLRYTTIAVDSNVCIKLFNGCSSLTEIYLNANSIQNPSGTMSNWVSGVAPGGVLHKKATVTNLLQNNTSGIPSGWTTVDDM